MTEQTNARFLAARRAYIERQFSNLNPMQREAVLATDGPLLLLAGAGSGKTTVLIHRIANLIRFGRASDAQDASMGTDADAGFLESLPAAPLPEEIRRADALCAVEPAPPWSILAITFTNKAANELKTRLSAMLGACAQDIWAMTFHSACCRILRRDIERLGGYRSGFTIYDSGESEHVMRDVIRSMGLDDKLFPPKPVLSEIGRSKDEMVGPEELLRRAESSTDLRMLHVARAYAAYQKRLQENNALDFDDIILLTVRLLRDNEDIRTFYQRKFRYVLVDEYQDTNHLQYMLCRLLSGGRNNLCVVGDDDQSIYRFRGATIENILNFEEQYPHARTIRLEQNYRSTQSILNAANAVISHNLGRKGKTLWTANGFGSPITVYEADNEGAEANYVAGQILSHCKQGGVSDCAILYRTNAQSNALEYAMRRNGIPYRIIGGQRFFERMEVRDMLSYLWVIHNRSDDLRLRRIINTPARGIGAKTIETAERLAAAEGKPLYQIISDPGAYAPLERAGAKLRAFCDLIESMQQLLDSGISLPEFYDELLIRSGYVEALESKPTDENMTRLENVRELKSSILAYQDNLENAAPSLAGFLEEIALFTDIEQYNSEENAVVMMTMHAAKGLEFPRVFLVGLEDGLFPGQRAIGDTEQMEEERRLCYVAITRAKQDLTISYARQRTLYGRTTASLPSRFVGEIPESCTVRKGFHRPISRLPSDQRHTPSGGAPYRGGMSAFSPAVRPTTECPELNKGDMVEHSAFGRGMVLSVLKMANDALLEIAFDERGTKKLMAKAAAPHLKKLQQ